MNRRAELEALEQRALLAVTFQSTPYAEGTNGALVVKYEVTGSTSGAFDVKLLKLTDSGTTTLLSEAATDLTVGTHDFSFSTGITDVNEDYTLQIQIGPSGSVHTQTYTGIFRDAGGQVFYFGTSSANTVTATQSGTSVTTTIGGVDHAYTSVTGLRIRTYAGADSILSSDNNLTVPVAAFGGIDSDTIYGGRDSNYLDGGKGTDAIYLAGGSDSSATNTLIGGSEGLIDGGEGEMETAPDQIDQFTITEPSSGEYLPTVTASGGGQDVINVRTNSSANQVVTLSNGQAKLGTVSSDLTTITHTGMASLTATGVGNNTAFLLSEAASSHVPYTIAGGGGSTNVLNMVDSYGAMTRSVNVSSTSVSFNVSGTTNYSGIQTLGITTGSAQDTVFLEQPSSGTLPAVVVDAGGSTSDGLRLTLNTSAQNVAVTDSSITYGSGQTITFANVEGLDAWGTSSGNLNFSLTRPTATATLPASMSFIANSASTNTLTVDYSASTSVLTPTISKSDVIVGGTWLTYGNAHVSTLSVSTGSAGDTITVNTPASGTLATLNIDGGSGAFNTLVVNTTASSAAKSIAIDDTHLTMDSKSINYTHARNLTVTTGSVSDNTVSVTGITSTTSLRVVTLNGNSGDALEVESTVSGGTIKASESTINNSTRVSLDSTTQNVIANGYTHLDYTAPTVTYSSLVLGRERDVTATTVNLGPGAVTVPAGMSAPGGVTTLINNITGNPLQGTFKVSGNTQGIVTIGGSHFGLDYIDASHDLLLDPGTDYTGGVTVTNTWINTYHDLIPRFAYDPTIWSVANGDWSDSNTWIDGSSTHRLPTSTDRVRIASGTTVTYDQSSSPAIPAIEIVGKLTFDTTMHTELKVAALEVLPDGELEVGTGASGEWFSGTTRYTAKITIADRALESYDSGQYGNGLIVLGKIKIHGAPIADTFARLSVEPLAGHNTLTVDGSYSLAGWREGDEIFLPDTRQIPSTYDNSYLSHTSYGKQWETRTITGISGQVITLSAALTYDHLGAWQTDLDGSRGNHGIVKPHVALLGRNVIISSEDPEDIATRGHTFYAARAEVDVNFADFKNLGRTTTDNLDPATNHVGRYAVHLHHLMGAENDPEDPDMEAIQYRFVGNTVEGSKKWAVAVHDTHYGLIQQNVIYDAQGAGFVGEEGSEIGNKFIENFTGKIWGTGVDGNPGESQFAAGNFANGGVGFWFRRGGNELTGNVSTDNSYAGLVISSYYLMGDLHEPNFPGADTHLLDEFGEHTQAHDASINPAGSYLNNEIYGLGEFGVWFTFILGNNLVENPLSHIENLTMWNAAFHAYAYVYHTNNVEFDNLNIYSDPEALNRKDWGVMGVTMAKYEALNTKITGSHIEGTRIGVFAPPNDASQHGKTPLPTIIENTTLRNNINLVINPAVDNRPSNGNFTLVDNVTFENPVLWSGSQNVNGIIQTPYNILMSLAGTGDPRNLTRYSVLNVVDSDFDGTYTDQTFQVYYKEQAKDYVVGSTLLIEYVGDPWDAYDGETQIGWPEAGHTNEYNFEHYGTTIAGFFAPDDADESDAADRGIYGLIGSSVTPSAIPEGPIDGVTGLSGATAGVVLVTPWEDSEHAAGYIRLRYNVFGTLGSGEYVWLQLDSGTPWNATVSRPILSAGSHTLKAYIGNSSGTAISNTFSHLINFTVPSGGGGGGGASSFEFFASDVGSASEQTAASPLSGIASALTSSSRTAPLTTAGKLEVWARTSAPAEAATGAIVSSAADGCLAEDFVEALFDSEGEANEDWLADVAIAGLD